MKVTLSGKQVDISDKLRKHVEDGVSASVCASDAPGSAVAVWPEEDTAVSWEE